MERRPLVKSRCWYLARALLIMFVSFPSGTATATTEQDISVSTDFTNTRSDSYMSRASLYQYGSDNENYRTQAICTRSCTIHDENDACWRASLGHYSHQLETALNEYIGTLLYIERWHSHTSDTPPTFQMASELLADILQDYPDPTKEYRVGPLTVEELTSIFEEIINKTVGVLERYKDERTVLPSFGCSEPCGYMYHTWKTLFCVTLAALVLCVFTMALYLTTDLMHKWRFQHYHKGLR